MHGLPNLLRRYASAGWRQRWLALAFAWLVCIGGWIGVSLIPDQYQSSARLYVDADAVLTPLLHGLALDSSAASDVDVLQRTLLSRPNLDKLISRTDLGQQAVTNADRERLVQALGTQIRIQPQTHNLFTIEYRNRDPKLARDVVQTIINLFVESATGNNRRDMENARQFLEQQIASYESKLRTTEQRRAEFQAKYVDLLPGASGVSGLETARGQVQSLQGQLQDAVARRNMLKQEMATTPPLVVTETDAGSGGGGPGRSAALVEAERALQLLLLRDTPNNPDVIAQQALVKSLRAAPNTDAGRPTARVAPRNHSVPNPLYEQLKVRLLDAEAAVGSLQRQVNVAVQDRDRLETIARNEPGLQAQSVNLNRDYDVLRRNYEELLARRESMRIGAAADAEADKVKLRVVDPPQISGVAVSPKRPLLMAGVLAIGLAAGAGLAFLLVQIDGSFYTVQDLRQLGLPVLGGISMLPRRLAARRTASGLAFGLAVMLLIGAFGSLASHPSWLTRLVTHGVKWPSLLST